METGELREGGGREGEGREGEREGGRVPKPCVANSTAYSELKDWAYLMCRCTEDFILLVKKFYGQVDTCAFEHCPERLSTVLKG